jgi:hypothetical protein
MRLVGGRWKVRGIQRRLMVLGQWRRRRPRVQGQRGGRRSDRQVRRRPRSVCRCSRSAAHGRRQVEEYAAWRHAWKLPLQLHRHARSAPARASWLHIDERHGGRRSTLTAPPAIDRNGERARRGARLLPALLLRCALLHLALLQPRARRSRRSSRSCRRACAGLHLWVWGPLRPGGGATCRRRGRTERDGKSDRRRTLERHTANHARFLRPALTVAVVQLLHGRQ